MTILRAAVIACAIVLLAAGSAQAVEVDDQFAAAVDLLSKEKYADAARAFVGLAEQAPKHRLADDALFAAGKLYEERLGDPRRAVELYQRLIRDYPDSRESLAAQRRATELTKGLGKDDAGAPALAAFTDVLQRFHLRNEAESVERMEQVIARYPDWDGLPRAMLWLGTFYEQRNQLAAARRWYLAAAEAADKRPQAPDRSKHLFNAYRGAGDVALKQERFSDARGYYESMPVDGDPSRAEARKQLLADLAKYKRRAGLYTLALLALGLLATAALISLRLGHDSWRTAATALLRPPTEVIFIAPVAAVLTLTSLTGHHPTAKAVTIISIGGILIAWLSGAALNAPRRSRLRIWLHLIGGGAAALCLCYVALHVTDLIDQMMQVLRLGPDVG